MASRRSKKKDKQRRHSDQVKAPQGSADQASKGSADQASKKERKFTSATPLTSAGTLDWNSVKLTFPEAPPQKEPAPMTSREMPSPAASISMGVICTLGIIMTGRWSLVLLAVLGAVLLIDPRVRMNRDLLLRITAAVVLCLISMPLISDATSDLSFDNQGLVGSAVILMFSAALFLMGGVSKRAARFQDTPFRQGGLYVVGLACQILCGIMLALGAVLITAFAVSQL